MLHLLLIVEGHSLVHKPLGHTSSGLSQLLEVESIRSFEAVSFGFAEVIRVFLLHALLDQDVLQLSADLI